MQGDEIGARKEIVEFDFLDGEIGGLIGLAAYLLRDTLP